MGQFKFGVRSFRREATSSVLALCLSLGAMPESHAQVSETRPAGETPLPPMVIEAPTSKPKPKPPQATRSRQSATTRPNKPTAATTPPAPPSTQPSDGLGIGNTAATTVPPLQQAPSLGKTGTKLEDLPASVQIIPREVVNQQGGTMLNDAISNASGIVHGGQDSKGYYDTFLIRGLNAQMYNDGFSDGDQLGGVSHSLNGVQRIEILEGPGSALFGSGPPGGTVNVVHYTPSSDFHYGASEQVGSFGTVNTNAYVTGPTTIPGLDYRIDATVSHADGFRDLESGDYEIRPDVIWHVNDHTFEFSLDARQLHETPDSYGIIYFNGSPLKSAPIDAKYSTPFTYADQNLIRPTVTDKWWITDYLTINNRFTYLYRNSDVLGNGDSTNTKVEADPTSPSGYEVVGRQLRKQHDRDSDFDYQLEPVWKFNTGSVGHTLLTGFEYVHETMDTVRTTADLPNIPNAFAPVPPETSLAGLQFQCNSTHSCDDDHMVANYYSLYATDQIDVTDRFKVRAGVRQDWWNTALTPLITVPSASNPSQPGVFTSEGTPLLADVTQERNDAPVSWNVGALYKLFPGVSPYIGASKSFLTNFNSENVQNGIGAPESALQYEAGIKFSLFDDRITLNTAAFDVSRNNVAAAVTLNSVETVVFDSQRTKGAEASLDAKVTDQWRMLANVTFQNAVITDNPQGITSVGNHPQGVPAYMANLWSTYKFSIAGVRGFMVGAGLSYHDKSYSDITNVNSIPAFVVADALFGYETDAWGISLNVKNFTNQRYYVAANAAGAYVGEPLSAFIKVYIKQ
jgi:iron complex outermembrane recepter protein